MSCVKFSVNLQNFQILEQTAKVRIKDFCVEISSQSFWELQH